ncbi:MAG: hypothetical protein NXY59_08405 [Aigarchaeota archaeon]|nr:hypothetical protein [Candidatus Pelearchaeum maunauluense]
MARGYLLKAVLACLVASTVLGFVFMVVAYPVVPRWLFTSITIGTVAYTAITLAAIKGVWQAYPAAAITAVITLTASLTSRAHYAFIEQGLLIQSAIFITGSILQITLLILLLAAFTTCTPLRRQSSQYR